jgi:hypothetical protein
MPVLKPHTRFLLRGSSLLAAMLVLWWFVLLNPLLYLLRESASAFAGMVLGRSSNPFITETSTGDWTVEAPLEAVAPGTPEHPAPIQVHSIDFDMARSDAGAFTFGLPVYWAIVLAAPGIRRSLRPLLLGTLAMSVVEIVLLLIFAELLAHKTAAQWSATPSAVANWFYRFGDYLLMSVIPYVAPFVVAIWLHDDLRRQIVQLGSGRPLPSQEKAPAPSPRGKRRGRSH